MMTVMMLIMTTLDSDDIEDCSISIANTLEILQFCTEPWIINLPLFLYTCIHFASQ